MKQHLILLPGLLCDGTVWEFQIAALADLARSSVADYGEIDSLPRMAAMVLAGAPERFSLAGHSMGGRVALEIYRQAPHRVEHLALLDTGYQARPKGEPGEREAAQRHALLAQAQSEGMRAMGRQWLQGMIHPDRLSDRALTEAILAMIERKTPAIFAAQIAALLNRPDAESVLRAIHCPTLVLCGREDSWSPLARHEDMARMLPGSTLTVIENAGHMSTMERPRDAATALRAWLEKNGAPQG